MIILTKELSGVYKEWSFARSNTIAFVKELQGKINKKLNRPELDTIKKHILEMLDVQEAYSEAIETKVMSFASLKENDEFNDEVSIQELLDKINEVDNQMKTRIENAPFDTEILWDGERRTLSSHIAALISHEMFHIGQFVGFCYAQNIQLPKYIVEMWGLSEQNL